MSNPNGSKETIKDKNGNSLKVGDYVRFDVTKIGILLGTESNGYLYILTEDIRNGKPWVITWTMPRTLVTKETQNDQEDKTTKH